MSKPDSAEFARQMLHHLAAISADVEENKLLLCDLLAEVKRLPVDQVRNHYAKLTAERSDKLYLMSCDEAKIDPPSDDPPDDPLPPPALEVNPRV